jgi:hypothetical protein
MRFGLHLEEERNAMPLFAHAVHFLHEAVRPALLRIDFWHPAAEELLLGTALVESGLMYRRQIGGGPGRGLFQMEPATHDDIWKNFLNYRPGLSKSILSLVRSPGAELIKELENNDRYASAMARAHYLRAPAPLPEASRTEAMANYWKQYYNTPHGAGTVSKYIQTWNATMGGA